MPWFDYEGLTRGRTQVAGRIEAADRDEAVTLLADMQLDLRELRSASKPPKRSAVLSADDLVFFNEQLSSLADAGIALDQGLEQLARDVESPRLRRFICELVADVRQGRPLEEAVEAREKSLPVLYSSVIRAGVKSGRLAETLVNLNQHLRMMGNTRRIIWEAVSYPLVVFVLALALVTVFFSYLVPQISDIYADFDAVLPRSTQLLIALSAHFGAVALTVGVLIAGGMIGWRLLRVSSSGRAFRDEVTIHTPIIGRLYSASVLARFLRAVAASVGSGIPLPDAMALGAGATGSVLLNKETMRLTAEASAGRSLFAATQSTRLIPALFGYCVESARGRADLPETLERLASTYESRVVHSQSMLRVVLYPVLIVFLGVFLGFSIMALFAPMASLIQSVTY